MGGLAAIFLSCKNGYGAHLLLQQAALIRAQTGEGGSCSDIAVMQEWIWCPPMPAVGRSNQGSDRGGRRFTVISCLMINEFNTQTLRGDKNKLCSKSLNLDQREKKGYTPSKKRSVAEPKLFDIWSRSRNYLFNKYLLQSVWSMLGSRKTNFYLH